MVFNPIKFTTDKVRQIVPRVIHHFKHKMHMLITLLKKKIVRVIDENDARARAVS